VPTSSRPRRLSRRRRSSTRTRLRQRRGVLRVAQHKKRQIAKRDHNDDRNKRQKEGETSVSSDEDPSPEPSWSGDVVSATIDWSNMSRSSSSSPPRGDEVSSSRWSREAGHAQRFLLPMWAYDRPALVRCPAERALPSCRDPHHVRSIPRGGRRSDQCPSARYMMAQTIQTLIPCRGVGREGGRRIRRRRQARCRWRNRALPCGAYSHCLSGVAGPQMSMCPLSQAGAMIQPQSLRKLEGQAPSELGRVLPP
jgi:hypothetical protein